MLTNIYVQWNIVSISGLTFFLFFLFVIGSYHDPPNIKKNGSRHHYMLINIQETTENIPSILKNVSR